LQCEIFREGLLSSLAPDAFWVNPPGSAKQVRSKLRQHHEALRAGLRLPRSAYTNDPEVIRRFIRAHGQVIYKPLYPAIWEEAGERWGIYTTPITEGDLVADPLLQAVPGIYQEVVPKAYELRITAIGHHLFAAKIRSQETVKGKLDWRLAWDELIVEPTELDQDIASRCLTLLKNLGLVFGCFDFIVTPEDDHIFLEVNQMGQFGFIERACGLPLIDAMSEFLLQGRADFQWHEDNVTVRLEDIDEIAQVQLVDLAKRHLTRPEGMIYPHICTLA
jgi:glutathione synthase/RimK-type ligase-like ATP-grasp enzyme